MQAGALARLSFEVKLHRGPFCSLLSSAACSLPAGLQERAGWLVVTAVKLRMGAGRGKKKKALVRLGGVLHLSVSITTQKEKNMLLSCLSRFEIACCQPFMGSVPLRVCLSNIFGLWNYCEICILSSGLKFWISPVHRVCWGAPLFSFVLEMFQPSLINHLHYGKAIQLAE